MKQDFSFDISSENKEKLMELFATDGVETIYIEKVNGELFPVANIERHPDCPKHIYEAWKRSLLKCELVLFEDGYEPGDKVKVIKI